jgi:glycosyltransferase involved in cell wall biosynthesis
MMRAQLRTDDQAIPATAREVSQRGSRGRIFFVTSNFPRWPDDSTTPFILHLAQDLGELGWNVRVLAPHAPGARTHEWIHGVEVQRFRYLWPATAQTVCYSGGALINLRRNPWNYAKLPTLVASEFCHVVAALARREVDIIHSHWTLPQGLVSGVASALARVPHVATVHGGDAFALRGKLMSRLKAAAFGLADVVTVNSTATMRIVRALGKVGDKAVRIPIGASRPPIVAPDAALSLRTKHRIGNGPLVIFVGRLVEEKGVGDLLHAVALLSPSRPDVSALILGDGQQRAEFEAMAAQLGIAGRVTFVGWVDPVEVPSYLAAADVFVGPSKSSPEGWLEGQGLTFVEAMLAGTPVVGTDCGGIVDLVKHEDTGLVVHQNDPAGIAPAIVRAVDDAELRGRIIANARALAATEFTRETTAQRFSAIYDGLLSRRPTRARSGSDTPTP